ncbi:hypothetical protein GUJ93_ZPchr0002g26363 [Zizania palustris]|uniref:Uncharacterized protein n=1 Tax=Zizania palustris TaxID=103762 RepID=A0A8J5SST8_ZIZPA|nr:hypothetical protein GUJ93_ZPchr0002g26363 [Zizania palustris]
MSSCGNFPSVELDILPEAKVLPCTEVSSEETHEALTAESGALVCLSEMEKWKEVIIPSTEVSLGEIKAPVGGSLKQGRGRPKKTTSKKVPPVALRQSSRIKRDGVPIQVKAQMRADQKDDVSGLSQFTSFQSVSNGQLIQLACDAGVTLGHSSYEIDCHIELLKAKEIANALLCQAKSTPLGPADGLGLSDDISLGAGVPEEAPQKGLIVQVGSDINILP